MTRTVTDAALLMNVLTKPDPRDYMALPYEARDWPEALVGEVRGKRLGLLIEIGGRHYAATSGSSSDRGGGQNIRRSRRSCRTGWALCHG